MFNSVDRSQVKSNVLNELVLFSVLELSYDFLGHQQLGFLSR